MKKKLYHTMVTHFCRFGGDPIDYWKYADNWDENQKLVAIDFNNRHGFIKSHLVKMELVKVYEEREVKRDKMKDISYEIIFKLASGSWVYSNGRRFLVEDQNSTSSKNPTNEEALEILTKLRRRTEFYLLKKSNP